MTEAEYTARLAELRALGCSWDGLSCVETEWLVDELIRARDLLREARREHSDACGDHPRRLTLGGKLGCDCGADEHNAAIDEALRGEP